MKSRTWIATRSSSGNDYWLICYLLFITTNQKLRTHLFFRHPVSSVATDITLAEKVDANTDIYQLQEPVIEELRKHHWSDLKSSATGDFLFAGVCGRSLSYLAGSLINNSKGHFSNWKVSFCCRFGGKVVGLSACIPLAGVPATTVFAGRFGHYGTGWATCWRFPIGGRHQRWLPWAPTRRRLTQDYHEPWPKTVACPAGFNGWDWR